MPVGTYGSTEQTLRLPLGSLHWACNLIASLNSSKLTKAYNAPRQSTFEQDEMRKIINSALVRLNTLSATVQASKADRKTFGKIIEHFRTPSKTGQLAYEYDSINGSPIPEVYRPGVSKIFDGMEDLKVRDLHSKKYAVHCSQSAFG